MIADTTEELLAMADKIGVARKWILRSQAPIKSTLTFVNPSACWRSSMEPLEITQRELGQKLVARRSESPRGFVSAPTLDQLKATPQTSKTC
jgi:hypothetical protein